MYEINTDKFPDFISFPKTFKKYRWYKPILVLIIGFIICIILQSIVTSVFGVVYGYDAVISVLNGNYDTMISSDLDSIVSFLLIAVIIPSLYIASRIVRDRPFSSYASSRGGWDWKIYFKCLSVPLAIYLIYAIYKIVFCGNTISLKFSYQTLILFLFLVPLQCIAEEYLFRGFAMQTLGSWFRIPVLAIVIQAILFASLHVYDLMGLVSICISGILLGFLAWKTNGIEAGSAYHSINNLSVFYLTALGVDSISSTVSVTEMVLDIALLVLSVVLIYYIGTKKGWFGENTSESKLFG